MDTTGYHSKYFANLLTLQKSAEDTDRLSQSIFNAQIDYLFGLHVQHREKILIIWREDDENDALNTFFNKMEFDIVYVNGDNNLPNLRKEDEHFKVKLIEKAFKRLMFDA
jgi:hypothetical protein